MTVHLTSSTAGSWVNITYSAVEIFLCQNSKAHIVPTKLLHLHISPRNNWSLLEFYMIWHHKKTTQLPYNNTEMPGKYCQVQRWHSQRWDKEQKDKSRRDVALHSCCCCRKAAMTDVKGDESLDSHLLSGFCLLSARWRELPQSTRVNKKSWRRRGRKKKEEEILLLAEVQGYTVVQLYLIKSTAVLMWAQGISPNIQRAPCDAPTEDFLF